ncbi:MAG: endonuclease [Deltaproteobacteria bacterium]|nr:endonuclease [Deltaproteobacteria bacterium]
MSTLSGQDQFQYWSNEDKPDEWECYRAKRISEVQGNLNPFIADSCSESNR